MGNFKGLTAGMIGVMTALLLMLTPTYANAEKNMDTVVPFHSEIVWYKLQQMPIPEGRCTQVLPAGVSYLWMTKEWGTATSTHLGTGPYYVEFCVYGQLTDPNAPPGGNGIPMGLNGMVQIWTAANGDELIATGAFLGTGGTPGAPDFHLIDSVIFLDGGTGRFAHVEGRGMGVVYGASQTEIYDGWIRYSRE